MTTYLRISFDNKLRDIVEIRASRIKEQLYEGLPPNCFHRGTFDEEYVDSIIEEVKPDEIYIDVYSLTKFSYGFYRKYQYVIKEENYNSPNNSLKKASASMQFQMGNNCRVDIYGNAKEGIHVEMVNEKGMRYKQLTEEERLQLLNILIKTDNDRAV